MAKKRNQSQIKRPWYKKWQFWAIVGVIVAAGALVWLWRRNAPPALPADYQVGNVTACLAGPAFTAGLGLESPAIDTSQVLATGLVIREPFENGRFYQHETWDDAGNVGPFAYDGQGDIYLGPTPLASLQTNPTAEQNWIYKVDSQTAVMEKYLELPWPLPPSGANPFGIIGLTYDCDTNSLYAATVAGSTAQEEVGGIYQIDLKTGQIISQLDNIDAIGLGIFNGTDGKRLYFGSARAPEVHSISLNADTGEFYGEPRFEFSLVAQPGGSFDNANRIQFTNDGLMAVKGNEFSYSLQVASDPQRNIYSFQHNPEDDSWVFLSVQQQ
ncbi:MAG: DUF2029 domain-containing protein [Anaerolineae bacterium]|nr:DUF2029 domain-containing protein [Anaerolineae bacterium]